MHNNKAFTLVELSIVLLIIGLIIGGITAGSSLIKQAQIRAVISELNQYKAAVNTFRIQFSALPGDFNNATAFWYNSTSCPGTNLTAGSCNGNGDGYINRVGGSGFDEDLMAWKHLVYAGMITGNYTGQYTTATQNDFNPNTSVSPATVNVPASKYNNGGWFFDTIQVNGNMVGGVFLYFGGFVANSTNVGKILLTNDAYNIDTKLDDGIPMSGSVRGAWYDGTYNSNNIFGNGGTAGTTCASGTSNTYNLTLTTPSCIMQFQLY